MSQHGLYIPNLTSEEEAILKALPAFEIYNKFNKTGDTSKYNGSCETVSPNIREFKNLCTKFLHNIKNLPDYNHDRGNHNMHSKYLYYWIFNEINKISIANPNKINPSDVNRFLIIGNTWYSDLYHAPFIKEFNFDFGELKEQKYLYDYFENFNALNEITCPHSKSRAYYKYVDFINKFYTKKIKEQQCCIWNRDCEPYFDCDNKYNPKNLSYKLKCGPQVDTLRWKQRHQTSRRNAQLNDARINFVEHSDVHPDSLAEYVKPPYVNALNRESGVTLDKYSQFDTNAIGYREGNGNDNEHHATLETDEYGNPLNSLRFSRFLEGLSSTSKFGSSTRKSKLLKEELERDSIMDSNYEMNMDGLSEYSLEDENEDEDEHFGAPNRNLYFAYSPS
ncbi:VIR protein [Plasmodium vivax]|uniref:VIR protein n=1 Tax=Plasmodium vivax TaxID=5855 RepID=A0A1G4EJ73_PLAVI|nr:VIR protein [Plasmodium vivax]